MIWLRQPEPQEGSPWTMTCQLPTQRMSRTPAPTTGKRIVLVSHGQGINNVPTIPNDAPDSLLTELGQQQALALRGHAALAGCGLLVVSPLSRAVQTASLALGQRPACRTVLTALHSERISTLCDYGRPKSQLAALFPFVADWSGFAELPEDWEASWSKEDILQYVQSALTSDDAAFCRAAPESDIREVAAMILALLLSMCPYAHQSLLRDAF